MSIATEYNWEHLGCVEEEFMIYSFYGKLHKRFILAQAKDFGRFACCLIGQEPTEENDTIIKELNSTFFTAIDILFNEENTIDVTDDDFYAEIYKLFENLWNTYIIPVKE